MAVAVKPSNSLLNIRSGIKSIKDSFSGLRKNAGNLNDVVLKKTKVKRESIVRNAILSQRRQEQERRKNKEDLLEASTIGGAVKRQAKAVASSTKGFLGRIMDFLGTLLVGWLLTNLPSIITMAQELIARIQRLYTIVTGFFNNTIKMFRGFGNLLGAVGKNILTFDFTDSKGRVESALTDLGGTFGDMQSQFDEGFKLLTTSLGEGVVSGENAQPFGTQYENESMQEQPSGGTSDSTTGGGGKYKPLLDLISSGESPGGGYSAMYPSESHPQILNMSITEVIQFQKQKMKDGRISGAIGRYQMLYPEKYAAAAGIPLTAKFSPENQDKMVIAYLKKNRRLGEWEQGKINDETLSEELAREFGAFKSASGYILPRNTGSIGFDKLKPVLQKIKSQPTQISARPTQTPPAQTIPRVDGSSDAGTALAKTAERLKQQRLDTSRYGRDGCVFAVNEVYRASGMTPPWGTSVYVPTARQILVQKKFIQVGIKGARPGDIVIMLDTHPTEPWIHIGIVSTKGTVIHNSSTNRALTNDEPFSSLSRRYVKIEVFRDPNLANLTALPVRVPEPLATPRPTPAQISPSGTQQRRQASQQLAQQPSGPSIIIIEEEPPAQQPQGFIGGGGEMMIPIVINPLNSFITKKLLLDLAYT